MEALNPRYLLGKHRYFYSYQIKQIEKKKCMNNISSLMVLLKNQGTYTELISISPKLIQIINVNYSNLASIPV